MSENIQELEQKKEPFFSVKSIIPYALISFGVDALKKFDVPFSLRFCIIMIISFLIQYWIPPRTQEPFIKFSIRMGKIILAVMLAFFIVPYYLKYVLPVWFAYFIPIFLVTCIPYFISKPEKRKDSLLKWLSFAFIFAVVMASLMSYAYK